MKILITGGTGFLGGWLVRGAIERGHDVRVLHRAKSRLDEIQDLSFESSLGDVTDEASLVLATRGVDAVIHAAAVIAYKPEAHEQMYKVNVVGTQNIINACLKNKVAKLVNTSSVVSVGASEQPVLLNENSPFEMKRYGLGYYNTKHEAEELVLKAAKAGLINAVSVNPAIMFGPGDGLKDSRKIHLKVARGKMPFYPSGGVNVMDVRDAVDGHFVALEKGVSGERYILSGENIYVKDLFQWLAEAGGVKPPNVLLPKIMLRTLRGLKPILNMAGVGHKLPIDSAFLSTFFHWYDNTKAKKDLGLKTRSARQAVIESIAWCKSQGLL